MICFAPFSTTLPNLYPPHCPRPSCTFLTSFLSCFPFLIYIYIYTIYRTLLFFKIGNADKTSSTRRRISWMMWFQRHLSIAVTLCQKLPQTATLWQPCNGGHLNVSQSSIQFTSAGDAKWRKRLMWFCSLCSRRERRRRRRWRGGSETTDERRERGWSDWSGRSSRESDWSGWSNNGFWSIAGVVMKTSSEEVVTHHLDELWHLGPGKPKRYN